MAKSIMIQGTMSNVGKSLLVAALCRIFREDGYSCAPFKSQNMALNSYITKEGLEIGRAQAMQAKAAGIEPSVFMNPILLKPTTDMGSQVIVNGKVRGNKTAMDYFSYKKTLVKEIMYAYDMLASSYDIIVIEGAGSPAEINLKADDIVNMGMAKRANAPVLLVGDIDRGGVFAQLLGTLMLLEKDERDRVMGLVINKFRGDRTLLETGLAMLEEMGEKPVLGVIPYLDCDLEDEDSLSEKLEQHTVKGLLDIAVLKFPRISNFTDFDVFFQYPNVSVRYVSKLEQLKNPDLIILPGTKNTISDLKWLRANGLEAAIKKLASSKTPIFGICGGYQMLGKKISDPEGVEGGGNQMGMGLLDIETTFSREKIRARVSGRFKKISGIFSSLSEIPFEGYEIHMGNSLMKNSIKNERAMLLFSDGRSDGLCEGNIYGSYVHGIFDQKEISEQIVKALYQKKGLSYGEADMLDRHTYQELQYHKLAEAVRNNLDIESIYKILC